MLRYRANPTLVAKPAPEAPKAANSIHAADTTPTDPHPEDISRLDRKRAQARERKRRQRERQKLGVIVVPICVFEDDLDAALQRGEINEEEIDNRERLSTFLEDDLSFRLRKGDTSL
jgi:hypothetical protein